MAHSAGAGQEMSSNEILRLQSKKIDDLYEELGRALMISEYPSGHVVERTLAIERGRTFLTGALDRLKAKICVEWRYCSKRTDYGNFQSLVYAVAPLVSSVVGIPASTALIVAVIVVKIGLDDVCKCSNA